MTQSEVVRIGQLEVRYLIDGAAQGGMGIFELTVPRDRMCRLYTVIRTMKNVSTCLRERCDIRLMTLPATFIRAIGCIRPKVPCTDSAIRIKGRRAPSSPWPLISVRSTSVISPAP